MVLEFVTKVDFDYLPLAEQQTANVSCRIYQPPKDADDSGSLKACIEVPLADKQEPGEISVANMILIREGIDKCMELLFKQKLQTMESDGFGRIKRGPIDE